MLDLSTLPLSWPPLSFPLPLPVSVPLPVSALVLVTPSGTVAAGMSVSAVIAGVPSKGSAITVPILPSLKSYLDDAFEKAADGEQYVFPTLRLNTNPGTSAKKMVTKAKQQVWANFFNSLRASALTDLMDDYGLRRACQWAGNSAVVAMKNYALVRKTDFVDDGNSVTKIDAKSDAIGAADAKSDAASDSNEGASRSTKAQKNAPSGNVPHRGCVSVDDIGLESLPETRELCTFDPKATPNPTPCLHDEKLAQIIAVWPLLSGDLKTKIYECVIAESRLADAQRSA